MLDRGTQLNDTRRAEREHDCAHHGVPYTHYPSVRFTPLNSWEGCLTLSRAALWKSWSVSYPLIAGMLAVWAVTIFCASRSSSQSATLAYFALLHRCLTYTIRLGRNCDAEGLHNMLYALAYLPRRN